MKAVPVLNDERKRLRKRYIYSVIAICIIVIITFSSSVYAKNVLSNELAHFWVPFPAGKVTRPLTVSTPDGGRVFARPIKINVHEQGILKRIFNPWVIGVSTHWLVNTGDKPYRIGLDLTNTTFPVKWEVSAGIPWDSEKKAFTQPISAGERIPELGIDWFFYIPEEVRSQSVWYEGGLVVYDADTGETLTFIPINIISEAESK